jgi:hypothetical protein
MRAIFEFFKPKSGLTEAKRRQREVERATERLMDIDDEETFKAGLEHDFGIKPDHPKFKEILNVWRASR